MRPIVAALVAVAAASSPAIAQPATGTLPTLATNPPTAWVDTPALIAAATATVDDALRACFRDPGPHLLALIATRAPDGHTAVSMPFPNVGQRGFTPEERCLMTVIPRVSLPALPADFERILLGHVVGEAGASPPAIDPAFAAWRDPATTVADHVDAGRRAALAACDPRPRTVRVILDLRRRATRAWLPAWQFHSARHDGTTPPAQRRIKACLTRAVRGWQLPVLPRAMPEIQLAIPVTP